MATSGELEMKFSTILILSSLQYSNQGYVLWDGYKGDFFQ
jgi:hypothetical protein